MHSYHGKPKRPKGEPNTKGWLPEFRESIVAAFKQEKSLALVAKKFNDPVTGKPLTEGQVQKCIIRQQRIGIGQAMSLSHKEFQDEATQLVYRNIIEGLGDRRNKYWDGRGTVDVGNGLGILNGTPPVDDKRPALFSLPPGTQVDMRIRTPEVRSVNAETGESNSGCADGRGSGISERSGGSGSDA